MNYLHIEPYKTILVLNMDYNPINFTNWKRAVVLLLKEKAQVLSSRVIRLIEYVKIPLSRIMIQKPTRALIYQRDDHTCQYCGSQKKLTIDHIVPRSRGGQDTWENMVVACSTCNTKKGNTLLEQTGMKLRRVPKPMENKITLKLHKSNVIEWKSYIY
jgi:5-methylcytosine-specific restriction endonuclease McrA